MKVYLVQLTLYINGKPFEINYMESSNEYHPEVFWKWTVMMTLITARSRRDTEMGQFYWFLVEI